MKKQILLNLVFLFCAQISRAYKQLDESGYSNCNQENGELKVQNKMKNLIKN